MYLIDEIAAILENAKPGTVAKCLDIMYSRQPKDTWEGVEMFIDGLKENSFFEYVSFINGIKRA